MASLQKNIVLHDFFRFPGGGEQVAMVLAKSLNADLWTSEVDYKVFPAKYFDEIKPKTLAESPFFYKWAQTASIMNQFENIPKIDADYAFFSGALSLFAQKNIVARKILYCHTPPRILFDQRQFYKSRQKIPARILWSLMLSWYKKRYIEEIKKMDIIVANSLNVKKRIRRYLKLDSQVIYPPVEVDKFKWISSGDYYLSTARTDSHKRVDIIVKAFINMPDKKLIVTSGGPELEKLKKISANAKNIVFTGWVDNLELINLMGNAIATIYFISDL